MHWRCLAATPHTKSTLGLRLALGVASQSLRCYNSCCARLIRRVPETAVMSLPAYKALCKCNLLAGLVLPTLAGPGAARVSRRKKAGPCAHPNCLSSRGPGGKQAVP